MAKKAETKISGKKAIKQIVATNLESLMVKIDPKMGDKKIKQKIKKAGKILVKGIKVKKVPATPKVKDPVPAT